MAEALTALAKLLVVQEIEQDVGGATVRFQQGGDAHLSVRDPNYASHLRLAQRSQERQHPVSVSFGEGGVIAEMMRADNDVPEQRWEEDGGGRVLFQGHDGLFHIKPDHPEAVRLRAVLDEAQKHKARVWFVAHKADLALLDVLPCQ